MGVRCLQVWMPMAYRTARLKALAAIRSSSALQSLNARKAHDCAPCETLYRLRLENHVLFLLLLLLRVGRNSCSKHWLCLIWTCAGVNVSRLNVDIGVLAELG